MRKSIQVDGFGHGAQPTPAASRVGPLLASGAIFGMDPATRKVAEGLERQCELMFETAGRILAAGGAGWDDVLKMTFSVAPEVPRELLNQHWVRLFPDAASRPARHVVVNDRLPAGMHLQCDLLAVVTAKDSK